MNEHDAQAVRRDRVSDLGLDEKLAEALVDLAPACDWDRHASGETGCEPGAAGEYVVRVRPQCDLGGTLRPAVLVVCEAQQIRLRGRTHATLVCETCNRPTTWGELVDFLGPVWEYYPHA